MPSRRLALGCAVCLLVLAAGCRGCVGREKVDAGEPDGSISELGSLVMHPLPLWGTVIGQVDANRYPFTVVLQASPSLDGSTYGRVCNGVLFGSTLALTAAHCLCTPSRGETIRYDGSECAAKAVVRVIASPPGEEGRSGTMEYIRGDVLIHPQFQMTLDARETVVTSRADLAIVRLDRPASPYIRPVRISEYEVQNGEVLSVVGFGEIEGGGTIFERWFSQEKVRTSAGDERLPFWSANEAGYKGDTGGPCLRETTRGSELVGISQRGLGLMPACTRVAPYREWLQEQIRLSNERD